MYSTGLDSALAKGITTVYSEAGVRMAKEMKTKHTGQLNISGYQRSDLRTGIIYVLLVFRYCESYWERRVWFM